jgi:REP element-mobilizing transposase RayT
MARPLRIEFAGALYHVTARGDRGEDTFSDERDRIVFLELLSQVCLRFVVSCHGYCLMSNHYHLVLETAEPNLARALRHLNGVYTQRFNYRHERAGHVFQGRYKAILVDRDSYFLEVVRYVLLNPVRAKLVTHAQDWPWSSYQVLMGQSRAIRGLDVSKVLSCFGSTPELARAAFERFIDEGVGRRPLWSNLVGQIFLGEPTFVERMQDIGLAGGASNEVPRSQRRRRAMSLAEYQRRHRDRDRAMASAYASGQYTMQAIARHFGVHYVTVSRAVRKAECG